MNALRKKIYKDNSGYSFLFVIFGVIFIAAIGVIALTMASNYYITTKVDQNATKQFYKTESVIQEIRTGLQEYANDSAKSAYMETIEAYQANTSVTRNDKYCVSFLSKLSDKLVGTGITWDGTSNATEYVCDIDKIKELTTQPDSVNYAPGTGSIKVILYNKDSAEKKFHLTVKNIYVDYTDEDGYNSKIKTDIVVDVPDYRLSGDATINELKNYIVITDNKLDISNSGGHQENMNTDLIGNIYAGYNAALDDQDSLIINNDQGGSQVRLFSDRIITRGDLLVKNGGDLKIQNRDGSSTADLWLQNFVLSKGDNSSKQTVVNSNANAYVQNDLVLNDNRSDVTLSGSYYGYCYNKDNTEDTPNLKSYYSSAILINGVSNKLNTAGLRKLVLAGRAFIEKRRPSGADADTIENISSDIQTGESLSVKSNQVAYLVPEKYMTPKENPVLNGKVGVVDTNLLLNDGIGQYLDANEPYVTNHLDKDTTYFFLKFKNEHNANEYFKKYYQGDEEQIELEESSRTYITSWNSSKMELDSSLYLLAGHIMRYYSDDGTSDLKEANYFNGANNPSIGLLVDGIQKGIEYVGRQLTLLPSGGSHMRLEEETDQAPLVSSKIIDFSEIPTGGTSRDYANIGSIYFVPHDTSVSATTNKGIIVADGNVEVNENFEGLILASGKVTVTGKVTAQNNIVMIKSILKLVEMDTDIRKIFREIDKFESKSTDAVSMADYVSYKNWSKNDD